MNFKKKSLLLTIFIVLTIQVLLYINNTQKSTFKYFVWEIRDLKVGKLISISFASGLLIGTILNKTMIIVNSKSVKVENNNIKDDNLNEFIDKNANIQTPEMPPQRDIRDPQPTISVNYRVVTNNQENFQNYEENISNKEVYEEDWNYEKDDW